MELLAGVAAFACFFLFDYNKIRWKSRILNALFAFGALLLFFSTILCVLRTDLHVLARSFGVFQWLCAAGCLLSFCLLLYVLFFALPFQDTYLESGSLPLVRTGLYAKCRHPGFWFFALLYLFLWLLFCNIWLLSAFFLYNLCNLIYIVWQDAFIFPRYISEYETYKKTVPFLFPRKK